MSVCCLTDVHVPGWGSSRGQVSLQQQEGLVQEAELHSLAAQNTVQRSQAEGLSLGQKHLNETHTHTRFLVILTYAVE